MQAHRRSLVVRDSGWNRHMYIGERRVNIFDDFL